MICPSCSTHAATYDSDLDPAWRCDRCGGPMAAQSDDSASGLEAVASRITTIIGEQLPQLRQATAADDAAELSASPDASEDADADADTESAEPASPHTLGVLLFDRNGHGGPVRSGLGDLDNRFLIDLDALVDPRQPERPPSVWKVQDQLRSQHNWARTLITPRLLLLALIPLLGLVAGAALLGKTGQAAEAARQAALAALVTSALLVALFTFTRR